MPATRAILFGPALSSNMLFWLGMVQLLYLCMDSLVLLASQAGTQHALGAIEDPVRYFLLHREKSTQHYTPSSITSYFCKCDN